MIPKFPFFRQLGEFDCGVTCLKMIINYFGNPISTQKLEKLLPNQSEGVTLSDISEVANKVGLKTKGVKVNYHSLVHELPTPCIAYWKQQHFVVIYHLNEEYVWIADPATRGIYVQSKESFQDGWICDENHETGILLLFEKTPFFSQLIPKDRLELSI